MIKIIPSNLRIYRVSWMLDNYNYLMYMYYTRVVDFLLKSGKIHHWIFHSDKNPLGF